MPKNNFKKPYPTSHITFKPVGKCIYCGSVNGLTNEHIIPKALNGTIILPKSICHACATITTKFEQSITKEMYGVMRNKRDYKTYHKKNRPKKLLVSYTTLDGVIKSIKLDVADCPDFNLVAFLPPPGILTKSPLSEMNPEFKISTVGDQNEIEHVISLIENESGDKNIALSLSHIFPWGDFCRLLAKIAHGYLVAYIGQDGYIPLLPDLILGHSPYLAHYIGGIDGHGSVHLMTYNLQLHIVASPGKAHIIPGEDAGYFAVYIHLLGGIPMPTYQVIAGKITDFDLIIEMINSKKTDAQEQLPYPPDWLKDM